MGSHIETPAWQSFELKMRARAAERRAVRRRRRLQFLAASVSGLMLGAVVVGGFHFSRSLLRLGDPQAEPSLQASLTAPTVPRTATSDSSAVQKPRDRVRIEARPLTRIPVIFSEPPPTLEARAGSPLPATREQPVITTVATRDVTATEPVVPPPASPAPQPGFSVLSEMPAGERVLPPPAERSAERPSVALESVPAVLERPASTETAAPAPPAPATPAVRIDPREPVRKVIERYRTAYQDLDAAAASSVWPGVNEEALARAFGSLASQELSFNDCAITVVGETADATCTGRARIVPKVGGGSQSTSRTWRFTLRQVGESWQIARATVR